MCVEALTKCALGPRGPTDCEPEPVLLGIGELQEHQPARTAKPGITALEAGRPGGERRAEQRAWWGRRCGPEVGPEGFEPSLDGT
jgi:hypothetical protein